MSSSGDEIAPDAQRHLLDEESRHSNATLLGRAIYTVIGRGGALMASFIFAIVVARLLAPSGRGDFALLQALNGITLVGANFAIQGAIVHSLGRRRLDRPHAIGAALTLACVSGLIAAAMAIPITLGLKDSLFPSVDTALLVAAILLSTPLLMREYLGGTMIAGGRSLTYVLSHAMQPIGALLFLLLILSAGVGGLIGVSTAWAGGILLSALLLIAVSVRSFGRPRLRREHIIALARFGIRTYPAILARFLNLRLDHFLIAALTSSTVLGIYAVAVNLGELLLQVPVAVLWAVSGSMSGTSKEQSVLITQQFCRWVILILATGSVILAAIAPFAVPLIFGPAYRGAVPTVWALLPGMILYAPALIITEFFIVHRARPSFAVAISVSSVVVNVPTNFVITPIFGAVGAAICSTLSYAAMFIAAIWLLARDLGQPPLRTLAFGRRDLAPLASLFSRQPKEHIENSI